MPGVRSVREGGTTDRKRRRVAERWLGNGWLVGIELRSGSWKITELTEPEYAI